MFNLNSNSSWYREFKENLLFADISRIGSFLKEQENKGIEVFPPLNCTFRAFDECDLDSIQVVILGQDPYHGVGEANGLCFSVNKGIRIPPSLLNIYKEIQLEFGGAIPSHGDLSNWSKQGVFLLNSLLSVEKDKPLSHQNIGWKNITEFAIKTISLKTENSVFLLWGSNARQFTQFIDSNKHLILSSPHPSPLSAHRGFLGNNHFKLANEYLIGKGRKPIDWTIH